MEKYALIGEKLGHSYSKLIHEKYFELINCDASYELVETPKDGLKSKIDEFNAQGYKGINVTIPYKIDMIGYMDFLSPEVEKIGSLNTVKFTDGTLKGYNTDYFGLDITFEKYGLNLNDKNVIILGTGGSSKAVKAICEDKGAKSITFVSRHSNGDGTIDYDDFANYKQNVDIIINCTPVGMYPNIESTPIDNLHNAQAVVDLIYNPTSTSLLKMAEAKNIKAVNGLCMLVAQAVYSQSIWNDTDIDLGIVDSIYKYMIGVIK